MYMVDAAVMYSHWLIATHSIEPCTFNSIDRVKWCSISSGAVFGSEWRGRISLGGGGRLRSTPGKARCVGLFLCRRSRRIANSKARGQSRQQPSHFRVYLPPSLAAGLAARYQQRVVRSAALSGLSAYVQSISQRGRQRLRCSCFRSGNSNLTRTYSNLQVRARHPPEPAETPGGLLVTRTY